MKITFYNNKFEKSTKELSDSLLSVKNNLTDLVSQYLRVYFTNQRQGNASTKSRSEVRGGGKKPWKQKGTGRARHGSIRSPLWVGGGVSHGPKPVNYSLSLNTKMKKKAYQFVITQLLKGNKVVVVDFPEYKKPNTKEALNNLQKLELDKDAKALLLTTNEKNLIKSFANINGVVTADFMTSNVFDILKANTIILTANSFEKLKERLEN